MSRRTRPRVKKRRLQNLQATPPAGTTAQPKTWYRIKNLVDQPDTAVIYLFGEIGYWGVEAQDFVRDLMGLRVSNLTVRVNSPGGEVFEGIAIYHALRDHPAHVTVIVDGLAASAASFIAMAGDTVVMQRNATMMIHDAIGIEIGNAAELRAYADLLDKVSDNIADIYSQQGGGTAEQWRAAMKQETWYSADEALAAGLCDEITHADGDTSEDDDPPAVVPGEDEDEDVDALMAAHWDLSLFAFTYPGREKAPAPKPLDELVPTEDPDEDDEDDEPDEPEDKATKPAASNAGEDAPDEPDEDEDNPDEGDDGQPKKPAPEPTDTWAALTSGLLTPEPAPTWGDQFAALMTKGIPA